MYFKYVDKGDGKGMGVASYNISHANPLPSTKPYDSPIHRMGKIIGSNTRPMGMGEVQKLRGPIIDDMSFS